MPSEPVTPGYEITRFEVRAFMAALGLTPERVLSLHIENSRVIARLAESGAPGSPYHHPSGTVVVRIKESRG